MTFLKHLKNSLLRVLSLSVWMRYLCEMFWQHSAPWNQICLTWKTWATSLQCFLCIWTNLKHLNVSQTLFTPIIFFRFLEELVQILNLESTIFKRNSKRFFLISVHILKHLISHLIYSSLNGWWLFTQRTSSFPSLHEFGTISFLMVKY